MHIVALTTCHNRRDTTLASLYDLHSQQLSKGTFLEIVVVDDGCSDGTPDEIRKLFPKVEIVQGTGSLFWAGGMRYGWEHSVKHKHFDNLIVFNDDIRIDNEAVCILLQQSQILNEKGISKHAVSGAFKDPVSNETTYSGFIRSSWWHPLKFRYATPNGELHQIDTLNMNFSLISKDTLDDIGFLASYFTHIGADTEFGLRLNKSGGSVWLTPQTIGICARNSSVGTSQDDNASLKERWHRLTGIKEEPPLQRAQFFKDHGGKFWPLLWISPYIKFCVKAPFETVLKFLKNFREPLNNRA